MCYSFFALIFLRFLLFVCFLDYVELEVAFVCLGDSGDKSKDTLLAC